MSQPAAYRIEGASGIFFWAFLAIVALAAHLSGVAILAFLLIPLGLVFTRLNAYRFLVILLGTYLVFFPPGMPGTNMVMFFTGDSLAIAFAFLMALSFLKDPRDLRIPISPTLIPLFLVVAYVILSSIRSIPSATTRIEWVVYDIKNILYLLFVPALLALDGRNREPKKFFFLLATISLFCSIHSLMVILRFLMTHERVVTWNEIFISDGVIVSLLLLRFKLGKKMTWLLRTEAMLSILGLLITQTRGLWISTFFALVVFYGFDFFRGKKARPQRLIRTLLIGGGSLLAVNILLDLTTGSSLIGFIGNRMHSESLTGLINPFTSIGYRIHEAWTIWDKRTLLGHGAGAPIHVYLTTMGPGHYVDWWAIHSGYFEFLHKFGFVGLGIILWMFGAYFRFTWRLAGSVSRAESAFGAVIATVILNTLIVSITSGYLFRHGVIIWVPLFFIAERLRRTKRLEARPAAVSIAPPVTPPLPDEREVPA